MYWNIFSLFVINSFMVMMNLNIGCIETEGFNSRYHVVQLMNLNIGCIETCCPWKQLRGKGRWTLTLDVLKLFFTLFLEAFLLMNLNIGCIETIKSYVRDLKNNMMNLNIGCIETTVRWKILLPQTKWWTLTLDVLKLFLYVW